MKKNKEDLRRSIIDKRVNYVIGDVKDYKSTLSCTKNIDYVFQAAALKQVQLVSFSNGSLQNQCYGNIKHN